MDILNIGTKIENEGKTSQGMLSADEFNQLIQAVIALQRNNVDDLQTQLNTINNAIKDLGGGTGGGGGASSEEVIALQRKVNEIAAQIESIRKSIATLDDALATKIDRIYVEENELYAEAGGEIVCGPIDLSNGSQQIQRNVRLVNNLDSKSISASKNEPCFLKFTFISQERYSNKDPYENTGERGMVQISVRTPSSSEYVVVKQLWVPSNEPISVDIAEYLQSGSNLVMIKITGEITETTTPAFVYTVALTSLSISAANFKWQTAYFNDILFPMNIGGNIAKVLHVGIAGQEYNESYEVPLGTAVYIETSYNYTIPHPRKSGIYTLSVYVASTDGMIKTRTISYKVMCVASGDNDVKLIAINNLLDKAVNWSENTLFDYAMYDGDNVSTAARFEVQKDGMSVFTSNENNITTSAAHTFTFPMEIETMDSSEFDITVHISNEDSTPLTTPLAFAVNNSSGYSATPGAVFYMNPRTRSNRQDNRRVAINEIDQSEVACTWQNMNWGNDGWTSDAEGNKVLRLLAGASLEVDFQPFATEAARVGKTIEIDYKVDNVTDFSQPVLSISTDGELFSGLRIYADEIVMYSQSLKNRDNQSTYVQDGKRIRLCLAIMPDAYGNKNFNLCIVYVNGVKNREFTYESNDYFLHSGKIAIGSDAVDVDIYGIRVYDLALTSPAVLRNYINWLTDNNEKKTVVADNDVMDVNGSEIDFENTRDQFNVLVFDNTYPALSNPNEMSGTLDVFYADHPEWNVSISHIKAKGQGTSSMRYWKWNVRFTLDKKLSVVTATDGSTSTGGWAMTPALAKATKMTAKKNFASSMHSHKIGSVNSVDELYRAMGYLNEAMKTDKYAHARVAVYQLPFVAFEKSINEEGETVYTFMGLYTMGPDKGDKNTFGYDSDLFPGLISIEGSDNAPLCTLFRIPWNESAGRIVYNEDEEAFQYNGANSWDFGAGDIANISQWIPAYNLAYQCSPRLKPFNGTVVELNAQAATLRNEPVEFWIAKAGDANQYGVYYFEAAEGRFIASDIGEGPINLKTQLNTYLSSDLSAFTADQLNELFISSRIQKFRAEAPLYWDIDDAILHRNWVEFHAGTDNRAKNTYPYCFGNEGSKWKWRYDDLDTIFDIDNQGQAKKGYNVEYHDAYSTGGSVWNGETSNFWNLIDLAFADEVTAGMKKMLQKMEELGGLRSGTDFDKLFAYFKHYYFNQAQEYFPQNLYNADAKFTHENAKLAYDDGRYTNDTEPMTQALGDHYSAEQRWITKRILYMMSKYSFGLFSADGTDNITVRAAGNTITYQLTPAMDLYPAIANGTSISRGARTKAGEACEMLIELSGSGDQQNTIQGASYLQDIGNWHTKNVTGTMIIQGRKLREIRLGHKTEPIVISISALTVANCVSLQKLVLSRIATLAGTLNLTSCTHLREVHIDGTSLTQLRLPEGGGLELIEFNALAQYLILRNYPLLKSSGVIITECKTAITDFLVSDCPMLNPMELLIHIMDAQSVQGINHVLKRIRAVGFDAEYNSAMLDRLTNLADGSYVGLSSEGLAGEDEYPVLDGRITINGNCYEDSVNTLRGTFKKLELIINGVFYIRFADPAVLTICASNWGDGKGITKEQAAEVTGISNKFSNNTVITSFNEFQYFGIDKIGNSAFLKCTSLQSIIIGDRVKRIDGNAFNGCRSLVSASIPQSLTYMDAGAFKDCLLLQTINSDLSTLTVLKGEAFSGCKNLEGDFNLAGCQDVGAAFSGCEKIHSIILPDVITEVANSMCRGCSSLVSVNIPNRVIKISDNAFNGCSALSSSIILPSTLTSIGGVAFGGCPNIPYVKVMSAIPPTLSWGVFSGSSCPIYVPSGSINLYKSASGWKDYASRIVGF